LKMWGAGGHHHSIELRDGLLHSAESEAGATAGAGIVNRLSESDNAPAADEGADLSAGGGAGMADEGDGLRSSVESAVFVGWMGIGNVLVLWLPLAVCHYTGYQRFDLPAADEMPLILLDCALEGAYLVWVVLAIALSSPLFVTIGTVLAIPSSAGMDALLHGIICPTMSLAGTGLVVCGFVGINIAMFVEGRDGWPSWL